MVQPHPPFASKLQNLGYDIVADRAEYLSEFRGVAKAGDIPSLLNRKTDSLNFGATTCNRRVCDGVSRAYPVVKIARPGHETFDHTIVGFRVSWCWCWFLSPNASRNHQNNDNGVQEVAGGELHAVYFSVASK